jgi:hypothetical protein
MWWLSTRVIRRVGEPEWADYINFLGLPHLGEVRSIDSWCNPYVETPPFPVLFVFVKHKILLEAQRCSHLFILEEPIES